jgi:hypothetical protein
MREERFLFVVSEPDLRSVSEDWKDDADEDSPPGKEGKTTDRVI